MYDVIESFADSGTRDIFDGTNSKEARKSLRLDLWHLAGKRLDQINRAKVVGDLRIPPSNRLEVLPGNLAGRFSVRINDQYRIIFKFKDGKATGVKISKHYE